MAEINGIKVPFLPIEPSTDLRNKNVGSTGKDFGALLQEELEKVKFSSHAIKRLESRNIQISNNEVNKLQTAIDKAEMKGSKDSLVMMNDTAYIVNIPNRTVITAMALNENEDNIFTNIDSVVFA